MRFPNKYGGIVKNGGKRRRPYQVRRRCNKLSSRV